MPQNHVHELVATLPDGRVETIGDGHFIHETQPEAFLASVEEFLPGSELRRVAARGDDAVRAQPRRPETSQPS